MFTRQHKPTITNQEYDKYFTKLLKDCNSFITSEIATRNSEDIKRLLLILTFDFSLLIDDRTFKEFINNILIKDDDKFTIKLRHFLAYIRIKYPKTFIDEYTKKFIDALSESLTLDVSVTIKQKKNMWREVLNKHPYIQLLYSLQLTFVSSKELNSLLFRRGIAN